MQGYSLSSEPFSGFDQWVSSLLEIWQVPGLAVGIVRRDQLIFAHGYGVCTAGTADPIDVQTVFAVGSVTKPFTATALAILVDEGKLSWDDLVIKYLPDFQLADPYITQELTIRDLLCARSGLQGGQLILTREDYGPDEIVHRLRYTQGFASFRAKPAEHTFHFLIAGQLIEAVSKQRWENFVRERLLLPLGMVNSSTRFAEIQQSTNKAIPHMMQHNKLTAMPCHSADHLQAAGSLNTNVRDLAQWVRLLLHEGNYQGRQILGTRAIQEMQTPQIIDHSALARSLNPDAMVVTYGLGWFVHSYQGWKVVEHGGAPSGMQALVAMMPQQQLGVILLMNVSGKGDLLKALKMRLFDHYLGLPARDWSAYYLERFHQAEAYRQMARSKASAELAAQQICGTQPSLPLERYAGSYENTYYGQATISLEQNSLKFYYGTALQAELKHWHFDTFQATWQAPFSGEDLITFSLDSRGNINQLATPDFGVMPRVQ